MVERVRIAPGLYRRSTADGHVYEVRVKVGDRSVRRTLAAITEGEARNEASVLREEIRNDTLVEAVAEIELALREHVAERTGTSVTPFLARDGGVYVARSILNRKLVKIGFTRNAPEGRMAATFCSLLFMLDGGAEEERRLHAYFVSERTHGEFFYDRGELRDWIRAMRRTLKGAKSGGPSPSETARTSRKP